MTVLLQFISLIFYRVQIHRSMTVLLQFISLMFYRVQIHRSMTVLLQFTHSSSTGFRFTDPWRCFFSSSHSCSTGFRSEDWDGRSRSLVLCSVTRFCVVFEVCVWIIVRLEDPNMAHYKIYNTVSHLLIFICWYLIESMMHVSKQAVQTSSRNIGPLHRKYSSIFHCTHDGVLLSLCSPNSSWVFAFFI